MILIDADAMPQEPEQADDVIQVEDVSWSGAPVDLLRPTHHLYTDLRRQMIKYRARWSSLPQVRVPSGGAPLRPGTSGRRALILRQRLGLGEGSYDAQLSELVAAFQLAHGLSATGTADRETLDALNRGASYYERRLLLNMERARRLPVPGTAIRYIVVDAGSAQLFMYENGRPVDSMKVIVGKAADATPMMAASLRFASVNPYWNVPPDLVAKLIAPKVISGGFNYLVERGYEVLDSWDHDARIIGPEKVDWTAVAEGVREVRVRQLPGGANSMGAIKFMMPNQYGIYLHDTPNKALFAEEKRWLSNGCVRVEDAERLARWVFGAVPRGSRANVEEHVPLQKALPVYITYLTVGVGADGPTFRADPYDRDKVVLERFAKAGDGMTDSNRRLEIDLSNVPEAPNDVGSKKIAAPRPAVNTSRPSAKVTKPRVAAKKK